MNELADTYTDLQSESLPSISPVNKGTKPAKRKQKIIQKVPKKRKTGILMIIAAATLSCNFFFCCRKI